MNGEGKRESGPVIKGGVKVCEIGRKLGDDLKEDDLGGLRCWDGLEGDLADEGCGDTKDLLAERGIDEGTELLIKVDETKDVLEKSRPKRDREESKDGDRAGELLNDRRLVARRCEDGTLDELRDDLMVIPRVKHAEAALHLLVDCDRPKQRHLKRLSSSSPTSSPTPAVELRSQTRQCRCCLEGSDLLRGWAATRR